MTALQELRRLDCEQTRLLYPNLPEAAICPPNFNDGTKNGLTRCIVAYFTYIGGTASRVSITANYQPGVDNIHYATFLKGLPDITAAFNGLKLSIWVRVCKNPPSTKPRNDHIGIDQFGKINFVAHDFQSVFDWIEGIKKVGPAAKQKSNSLNDKLLPHDKNTKNS